MINDDSKTIGPNFIGVGVQRAGTSWLYNCLNEHKEIYMPQKEVHFFDQKFDKGIEWYTKLFDSNQMHKIAGEITPDYMFDANSISHIAHYFPNTKLIIILREPFDRAYSAFNLLISHGRIKDMTFDQAIEAYPWILEQSMYSKQLESVFKYFSKDQVKIYDFEDIKNRPLWLLRDVFLFLGVDSSFIPARFDEKYNVSGLPKFQNKLNLTSIQKSMNENRIGHQLLKVKRIKVIVKLKNWLLEKSAEKDPKSVHCSASVRQRIKDDLQKTSLILDRNYDKWY
jgi:hypothetical protein